ncbi:MAG: hypothetical protein WD226_06005 [Planctomycetota bacterium]
MQYQFTSTFLLAAAGLLGSSAVQAQEPARSADVVEASVALIDDPLAEAHLELLELAHRTAAKMPLEPHIKNRARAEERVVSACLAVDQPALARRYVEGIPNWRKGAGFADIAAYAVESGQKEAVGPLLALAVAEAEAAAASPNAQDWRPARIRGKIARVHALLGDFERALEFEQGLDLTEAGQVDGVRVRFLAAEDFDGKVVTLLAMAKDATFEEVQRALASFAQLHERFYTDEARRTRLEEAVIEASAKMPAQIRISTWMTMAENALGQGDQEHARVLIDRTRKLVDEGRWPARTHVPTLARLASLRHRAGQEGLAEGILQGALAMFEASLGEIADFHRTDALLPVAEAHVDRGDSESARAIYDRCLVELSKNPNARVRTDDLVDLCCSMVRKGVTANPEFRERLARASDLMQAPW